MDAAGLGLDVAHDVAYVRRDRRRRRVRRHDAVRLREDAGVGVGPGSAELTVVEPGSYGLTLLILERAVLSEEGKDVVGGGGHTRSADHVAIRVGVDVCGPRVDIR